MPQFDAQLCSVEDLRQTDRVATGFRPQQRTREVEVEVDVRREAARDRARHAFVQQREITSRDQHATVT